ncbi:hypothetical protein [Chromobacterium sphagni]|uniref:hypothetical protein n=1 Tax=Chromobacterium sphagni TaxID=1903179 RepID=UPI0011133B1F|nr:hypothetical protein [Chromobacterium sphagni]
MQIMFEGGLFKADGYQSFLNQQGPTELYTLTKENLSFSLEITRSASNPITDKKGQVLIQSAPSGLLVKIFEVNPTSENSKHVLRGSIFMGHPMGHLDIADYASDVLRHDE